MLRPLLLQSLLASVVALGYAAVVDNSQQSEPWNCKRHVGSIKIQKLLMDAPVTKATDFAWIGPYPANNGFIKLDNSAGGSMAVAEFRFDGCQAGPSFELFCTNCDYTVSVAGSLPNDSKDANGEPDQWEFYNFGPAQNINVTFGGQGQTKDSQTPWPSNQFTVGPDGLIRP